MERIYLQDRIDNWGPPIKNQGKLAPPTFVTKGGVNTDYRMMAWFCS